MKQQIEITGMTCGGCVKNVKEGLKQIEGVQTVEVSLNPPQAVIEANESTKCFFVSFSFNTTFDFF